MCMKLCHICRYYLRTQTERANCFSSTHPFEANACVVKRSFPRVLHPCGSGEHHVSSGDAGKGAERRAYSEGQEELGCLAST